jgi:four helix bundle protein
MEMSPDELRARTRQFALDVIAVCLQLGNGDLARLVRPQLLRAASGVASNHRACAWSRSRSEFCSRLAVVVEETDESELWLDVLQVFGCGEAGAVARQRGEAVELRAIFSKSRSTALSNLAKQREARRKRRRTEAGGASSQVLEHSAPMVDLPHGQAPAGIHREPCR